MNKMQSMLTAQNQFFCEGLSEPLSLALNLSGFAHRALAWLTFSPCVVPHLNEVQSVAQFDIAMWHCVRLP